MKESEINWASISNLIKSSFPNQISNKVEISQVCYDNRISKNGSIQRIVDLKLNSITRSLKQYQWRILLPNNKQKKVHGLEIKDGYGNL